MGEVNQALEVDLWCVLGQGDHNVLDDPSPFGIKFGVPAVTAPFIHHLMDRCRLRHAAPGWSKSSVSQRGPCHKSNEILHIARSKARKASLFVCIKNEPDQSDSGIADTLAIRVFRENDSSRTS
jgi:hypothetical protein